MKTKIVYAVVSDIQDNYFEQVWASAWSLKYHNPDSNILVLTDENTCSTISMPERSTALECIDEVQVVSFDKSYSNREKSRWIKTNLRKLVAGDFLFVDADTIITGPLDDVDQWTCSIGAVLDSHCHACEISDGVAFQDMYVGRLKRIFNIKYKGEDVFNSGVLFVKDDEQAHLFFEMGHKNWLYSNAQGIHLDQLPMLKTNIELGGVIEEIPGEYNCQIRFSIEYLTRAKILHTFATQAHSDLSVILGPEIYQEIKQEHSINNNIEHILLNAKEMFSSPSFLIDKKWLKLGFQPAYELVNRTLYSRSSFDRLSLWLINSFARVLGFISRHIR